MDTIGQGEQAWSQVQDFFLRAMADGYASGAKGVLHPHLGGWKRLVFAEPAFPSYVLEDEWCPSGGRTFIYRKDVAIWVMRYKGVYREEDIPFLKLALSLAYGGHRFFGGRGPSDYLYPETGHLLYQNVWHGDFAEFRGEECITDLNGTVETKTRGSHKYWGGMLV